MRTALRLFGLFRSYWGWLLLGGGLALLAVLANVALMATSGWFITAMGIAGAAGATLNYFTPAALIRACAMLRSGGRYAERVATHEATFRVIARLRVWLFRRVEPQSAAALDRYHSGDLAGRLRADVDRLETAYLRVFVPLAVAVLAGGLIVAWLGRFGKSFAWAEGILLVSAGFVLPALLGRLSALRGARQVHLTAALTEAAVDGTQGMAELLAFGADRAHREHVAALGRALAAEQGILGRRNGLSQAAMLLAANGALWSVLVLGIPLVRRGELAPADLVMVALASLAAFEAVAPLPGAFLALGGMVESARRVFALADSCPPLSSRDAEPRPPKCDIQVTGLAFAYGDGAPVIRGLDLDLPQGRRVALVGPIGAGKSTVALLLAGLLRPGAGLIELNGRPLESYDPETVRACFAVAPQNAGLFSGRVRDNLLLGKPEASDADLWEALAAARLDDFVAGLPEGLDAWLGEAGLTLSGGQARRLAVARALLRDAPVLVLDEPGEGLDYRTERALLAGVMAALRGRSLLLITHRTAGLDQMDEVVRIA